MSLAGIPQHLIQRVHYNFKSFYKTKDFEKYLDCLRHAASEEAVSIHAYALMSNHVHLLMTSKVQDGVSRMMRRLTREYTHYFNLEYYRKGRLWNDRVRPSLIEADDYLIACQRYIELSPVRTGIVSHPAEYAWSSYGVNALGEPSDLIKPHPVYKSMGFNKPQRIEAYRQLFGHALEANLVKTISKHTDDGYCLGGDAFRLEIERMLGRRRASSKRSRPAKKLQLRSCN